MADLLNIIDGKVQLARKKMGIANDEVELLSTLRENICRNQCTFNNGTTYLNENKKCTACGCNMEEKWRAVKAKCILGAW